MLKTEQSPVSRDKFREWAGDHYGIMMDVQAGNGSVLRIYNDDLLFPEISVLFVGESEKFRDTVEICGMYDKRIGEFRFVSRQLSSIIDGMSETECCPDSDESEKIYAEICRYAREAVERRGYTFEQSGSELYAGLRQTIQSGLSDMIDYAALLSARGEQDTVLDIRDLAHKMLYFWRDGVYETYEKGFVKIEQEYTEKFDQAVQRASETEQPPMFSNKKAANLLNVLAIHAEETTDNEDVFSVWECCHLAKRLLSEYPQHKEIFRGSFTIDESERFMAFGSQDQEHLEEGLLLGRHVLVFNSPIPDEQIPEGWHSYHLAGRNLYHADRLMKAVPEENYVGSVLSPHVLIRASYQSRQIQNQFMPYVGCVSLEKFCESYHLPQPDISSTFPEPQEKIGPTMC